MNVVVFRSEEENARAAARLIIDRGIEAVRERGLFHVALSGGSTPVRIFKALLADPIFAALVPKTPPPLPGERSADLPPVADYLVPRTGEKIRFRRVEADGNLREHANDALRR